MSTPSVRVKTAMMQAALWYLIIRLSLLCSAGLPLCWCPPPPPSPTLPSPPGSELPSDLTR